MLACTDEIPINVNLVHDDAGTVDKSLKCRHEEVAEFLQTVDVQVAPKLDGNDLAASDGRDLGGQGCGARVGRRVEEALPGQRESVAGAGRDPPDKLQVPVGLAEWPVPIAGPPHPNSDFGESRHERMGAVARERLLGFAVVVMVAGYDPA